MFAGSTSGSSAATDICVVGAGADQHPLGRHEPVQPLVGDPQQALAADHLEQLLGHVLPGQRPQPLSGASGHDQHVTHGAQGNGERRPRRVRMTRLRPVRWLVPLAVGSPDERADHRPASTQGRDGRRRAAPHLLRAGGRCPGRAVGRHDAQLGGPISPARRRGRRGQGRHRPAAPWPRRRRATGSPRSGSSPAGRWGPRRRWDRSPTRPGRDRAGLVGARGFAGGGARLHPAPAGPSVSRPTPPARV